VSLYRTWRPRSFAELVGQDSVVRTLRTALATGKIAHAFLFSGPRGSGKTSAAKILARCIECVKGPTPDPDNDCDNCRAIFAGSALDVIEIDAASNRGIDEIRALRESVKFAPAAMRAKVFIIDEAHMLTREGANAFLKTLEEPPAHAIFVLATTAPEALPPTILSRCQRYAFRRIPVPIMIERMREIAAAEGIAIDDGALGALAYRADGGLRDALTMLEQAASFAGGAPIDVTTVEAAFGTTGRAYARTLVDAILAGDASVALRTIDEASDAGVEMSGLVRAAIGEYRNLLVARIAPGLLSSDLAAEDAERVREAAAATPQPRVVRGLRLLADALAAGRFSGNTRLELETAVLRLVVQGEDPSLEALATRVALLEQKPASMAALAAPRRELDDGREAAAAASVAKVPVRRTEAPVKHTEEPVKHAEALVKQAEPLKRNEAPARDAEASVRHSEAPVKEGEAPATGDIASRPGASLQKVRSLWDQIRTRAYERNKPLKGPLSQATVDAVDDGVVTLGFIDDVQESLVRSKLGEIEAAIADVVGVPLRARLRSAPAAARGRTPTAAKSAHRAVRHESANSPDGEADLLAYARHKLLGAPTEAETS
jgi:DNA polymerase-3 subunit gamma/tau